MFATSLRFVLINITNIDMLKKTQTHRLAVRLPAGAMPTERYQTVTYPLPRSAWRQNGEQTNDTAPESTSSNSILSPRDEQAKRTFAILQTEPGENPWDLGYWRNWKSVMGNNILEWLLPIRHSPCCNHDSMVSDYDFGKVVNDLKRRYGFPVLTIRPKGGIEMRRASIPRQ